MFITYKAKKLTSFLATSLSTTMASIKAIFTIVSILKTPTFDIEDTIIGLKA